MKGLLGMEADFGKLRGFTWASMRFETYPQEVSPFRRDISLYDACYVALAHVTMFALIALDSKMAGAARHYCEVVTPDV